MSTTLYFFHDPMCSWCWAYRPTWTRLKQGLPESVKVVNVLGGLAADTDQPMPSETREAVKGHWQKIQNMLGTQFNFDFWEKNQPRRSTYKACRAVIAAANQGHEEDMIKAIQHGYYLRAMNPSETYILVQFARELNLNTSKFEHDLESGETHEKLSEQIQFARRAPISGFPSLVFQAGGEGVLLPVDMDYKGYRVSIDHINQLIKQ